MVANKMVFGKMVTSKMTSRQNDKAPVQIGMTEFHDCLVHFILNPFTVQGHC